MNHEDSSQTGVLTQRGQAVQPDLHEARKQSYQLDLILGVLLTAVTGSVFLSTACPTVYWYDSAEMATAAATLGIPHPPG